MLTMFRLANVVLLVSIVGCILGALAGLIVFVPFLAGAWALNLMALVVYEERTRVASSGGTRPANPDAVLSPTAEVVPVRAHARTATEARRVA